MRAALEDDPRERIATLARALDRIVDRPVKVMEVCGTHTVSIFRQGLRALLPGDLELVSGPGCPVCVTDQAEIDAVVSLARMEGITVATYGDMLKVPGSGTSLLEERSMGMDVRIVTSADQALSLAKAHRDRTIVLIAVGFETTAPATASVILDARAEGLENFLVLDLHKSVPPALEALASDPLVRLDALLLPGHVSVITGLAPYRFLPEKHGIACAVAGFDAEQIMMGLLEAARQVRTGRPTVASLYSRAVRPEGNSAAREIMEKVFTSADAPWRGLGIIPSSGYIIKEEFSQFDALKRLEISIETLSPPDGCLCVEVLRGLIGPPSCPLFGGSCTPNHPVGPCMVSTEGSCSAYFRFNRGGYAR